MGRASAIELAPIPPLTAHVVDQTGTLSSGEIADIDAALAGIESQKGSQIAVLIVPTTQPEAIEQYSLRVAEAWKLGRKKTDDGFLFLIAKNDHAMRFEVGYGLEGALPDALCKRIIDEIAAPHVGALAVDDCVAALALDEETQRIRRMAMRTRLRWRLASSRCCRSSRSAR